MLLFVLRDFDPRTNNEEVIREILKQDIENIWREIYKPEERFENSSPHDFFIFDFQMLSHKVFEEEKFTNQCKELRERFTTND